MQNVYSINQSDGLSLNFMNKPLINKLSGRGTERRHLYGITTEDTYLYCMIYNMERSKAALLLFDCCQSSQTKLVEKL